MRIKVQEIVVQYVNMNLHKHSIKCMEKFQDSKHEPENIQLPTHCTHILKGTNLGNYLEFCIHEAGTSSWCGYYPKIWQCMHNTSQKRPT